MSGKKKNTKEKLHSSNPSGINDFANDKLGENRAPEYEEILIPQKKGNKKSGKK
ncbi:MAG: hypothetical protein GX660_04985 [Clostridiaceae bacterium]|nr:hypothetical protein [Clostridiaceae bacterium]